MTFRLKSKYSIALAAVPALLSLASSSCNNECYNNHNAIPLAALYSSPPNAVQISIDSISVWGIGVPNDSMILNSAKSVSQINFPFRIDSNQSSFAIRYDALQRVYPGFPNDTITFTYENIPVFENDACGVYYEFRNVGVSYTTFLIDSVACPDGSITNLPTTNLQIYFRTQSE